MPILDILFPVALLALQPAPTVRRAAPCRHGHLIGGGESWHMPAGTPHVQGAPQGRRNMAIVFYRAGDPWVDLESQWASTGACAGAQ